MTVDLKKYLPSDEEVLEAFYASDRLWDEYLEKEDDDIHWLDPIDTVVLAAVERAVADERARHAREIECPLCRGIVDENGLRCACNGSNDIRQAFDYLYREWAFLRVENASRARKIERARSFLTSLVEHHEIVGTPYRLAKAALEALKGDGDEL